MAVRFLGQDPVDQELARVLDGLAQGRRPMEIERRLVDCKEDPGRRGVGGVIQEGTPENEAGSSLIGGGGCLLR